MEIDKKRYYCLLIITFLRKRSHKAESGGTNWGPKAQTQG